MIDQFRKAGLAVAAVTVVSGIVAGAAAFGSPRDAVNATTAIAADRPVEQFDDSSEQAVTSATSDMTVNGSLNAGASERVTGSLKVEIGHASISTMKKDPEPAADSSRSDRSSRSNDRPSLKKAKKDRSSDDSGDSVPVPPGERQAALVSFVQGALGTPYRWGGTTSAGYDCSGLMLAAYRSVGIKIPRTSQAQYAAYPKISKSDLQPGDLVFYRGLQHVAMYVGNGKIIHATSPGNPVRYSTLNNTMSYDGAVRPR